MIKEKTIILGITGSIAAYKACDLIRHFKKKRYNVICITTKEAEQFITPLTLETLSGNRVYRDMFRKPQEHEVIHVSLAKRADLILIAPATANIIGKLASGICDDLLSSVVFSSKSRVLIAPAMNDNMYTHKVTQKNIQELKKAGYEFVGPIRGELACGSIGIGHLEDPGLISKKIDKILK